MSHHKSAVVELLLRQPHTYKDCEQSQHILLITYLILNFGFKNDVLGLTLIIVYRSESCYGGFYVNEAIIPFVISTYMGKF